MAVTVVSCINKASRAPVLALDLPFLAYGVGNSSTSRLVRALSRRHCIILPRYCDGIVVVRDEADRSNSQLVEETESRRCALKNTFAAASCHRVFVFIVLASLLCVCSRCADNSKSKKERRSSPCIVLTRRQCKLKAKRTRCLCIVPFGEDRHSLRTRSESSSNLSFFILILSQSVMQVSFPGKFLRRTWDEPWNALSNKETSPGFPIKEQQDCD